MHWLLDQQREWRRSFRFCGSCCTDTFCRLINTFWSCWQNKISTLLSSRWEWSHVESRFLFFFVPLWKWRLHLEGESAATISKQRHVLDCARDLFSFYSIRNTNLWLKASEHNCRPRVNRAAGSAFISKNFWSHSDSKTESVAAQVC